MIYFDTSFLAPLILPEPTSDKIATFIAQLPTQPFAVSDWTRVEFASLIARIVRVGSLDARAALEADAKFETMVQRSFDLLLPSRNDFSLAKQYITRFETGLRAADALHLAIAGNHRARAIYSLDKTLLRAGRLLGLPVSAGVSAN